MVKIVREHQEFNCYGSAPLRERLAPEPEWAIEEYISAGATIEVTGGLAATISPTSTRLTHPAL
jgi:hypothetical protein